MKSLISMYTFQWKREGLVCGANFSFALILTCSWKPGNYMIKC